MRGIVHGMKRIAPFFALLAGCAPSAEERDLIALTNQAQVIFVATIEDVKSPNAKYKVEEVLQGYKADVIFVTFTGDLDARFAPGSRHLLFLNDVSYGLVAMAKLEPSRALEATPERVEFVRRRLTK